MIDVALLSIIRRWHLRDHVSLREIAKRLGISRNTVRRYLRSGTIEPTYSRAAGPTVLDGYAEKLSAWLKAEANRTRKQRRSLLQLHQDLCALGYTGSYDRVAAFARRWRQEQQERSQTSGRGTFVPLTFAPGDAFQFDWSEDSAVINGERTKLQIAQFKLCHSRAFFLRAYWLQTHEMLFDAHHHAFVAWGGIPRRGIYDNMKTAVDRVGRGKSREVNARFSSMVSHYLFDAQFCNPASGWEKGQIEKNVQDSRRRIWQRLPHFSSLEALNDWLADECVRLWQQIRHPACDQSIWQIWSEERPFLMPVGQPFDGFVEHTKRVSPTCLIAFERDRYSVPASYANLPVSLRVYADRLVVVAEGHVIAQHPRHINRRHDRGATFYDWRHYLAVLQRKPGALRNGAPFTALPEAFRQLQALLLPHAGGDREMVEILSLVLLHDEQLVLAAVTLALEAGTPSKQTILNILSRLLDGTPLPPLTAPQALSLTVEPEANVGRYDTLRTQEPRHAA
ncbi:IS21 family transposase [Pseudomonas aeruginosa]|nr:MULTISPECIES: IS21 family transposase [Pseudomonadota]MBD9385531.1 IS21 family transposase [Achromobacter sp. ACM02]AVK29375.1 helix-turn-helix family protein [Pseudomonas aeruginosa]AWE79754.1 helix-turn-helix family protein [Pseudomonas aeruginosa]AWS92396.1 IS21 family transposase [Pseudomonas aeruginosa]AXZ91114.1 IS21 family transposase [Pseudomonas aeruginosa]